MANPSDLNLGSFSATSRRNIVNSGKYLLIFIHGFDNTFEEAIKRAAFNRDGLRHGGIDAKVVTFTWPSAGVVNDNPPHLLTGADCQLPFLRHNRGIGG